MGLLGPKPVPGPAGDFPPPEIQFPCLKVPGVWEYMTGYRWADGKPREGSKLVFFTDDGVCKVNLNDGACKRGAYYSGSSFVECLTSLEKHLQSGSVAWRPWKK